jgi:hypothetical protein
MTLLGTGAVAIWHDIAPEGREIFYAWHGNEHMHERVGIPGFRRGRRFIAVDADLELFNLYEAQSVDVLRGDGYRERLNNPTPWTVQAVKHFRAVARSICQVAASRGRAQGGLVATLRYDVAPGREPAHLSKVSGELLPQLVAAPGVAAAHLLVADPEASGERTEEQKLRGGPANAVPRYVLIVEGWGDERGFIADMRARLQAGVLESLDGPSSLGIYRHQITVMPGA